jgi:NitT/TauT family transport system ATP-binding protein
MGKIEIRDFSQEYTRNGRRFEALKDINLSIEEGEFVCLIGHSGCGKSTLLSAIDGLLSKPKKGGIYVDGQKVTGPGVDRALIFQNYSLFPWMTAINNIIFAVEQTDKSFRRKKREQKKEYARKYLEIVGMEDSENKYPNELSGGMKQRIAIARALAVKPEILLSDEPFGALDPKNRTHLQDMFAKLWSESEKKFTVIFVTHDIDEAILLGDRIIFMDPQQITEDIRNPLERPRDRAALVGSEEYTKLRDHLTSLFYKNSKKQVAETIDISELEDVQDEIFPRYIQNVG